MTQSNASHDAAGRYGALQDLESLPQALHRAARSFGTRGITLYDRRGKNTEFRSWAQVLEQAQAGAGKLAALGIDAGDRVMICHPTGWPFLDAWFGAVLRGALPVAVAPAGAMGAAEAHAHKLEKVVERLDAKLMLGDEGFKADLESHGATRAAGMVRPMDEFEAAAPVSFATPSSSPQDLAFLQLTSGSTGVPRAVMIPHRAVLHNPLAMGDAVSAGLGVDFRERIDTVASWLPLHHDMGLVGCLLFSLCQGANLSLMRPETFLARPRVWLQAISAAKGGVLSPAPNFAYQVCVERIRPDECEGLDLSRWLGAMTGAEMIRPETVAAFDEKFGPLGWQPRQWRPCYGLAEGTLAVNFDQLGQGVRMIPMPEGAGAGLGLHQVVCVGAPVRDTQVKVTSPEGAALPDGQIGEVRAKGPGIFAGYYRDQEATAESLQDGWLVTGDLGFVRDGELYITGRRKNVLIVHGHNIMPQEIEWLAESVTGGGGSERCGAFTVARGADGEQVVLVLESSERDAEKLKQMDHEIRTRIGRAMGLPLADVLFVRRGQIPKTTSGKVQHGHLRARYLDGTLERLTD